MLFRSAVEHKWDAFIAQVVNNPAMKAIQMQAPGGFDVLKLVELPTPSPGPKQVRIKAHAIGVSMPEVMVRKGIYHWMPPMPAVPGIEMSGIIDAVGPGVTTLRVGQPVFASAREFKERGGCYAEYLVADEGTVYALPAGIDLDLAACLSNYQVAWHLLNTACQGFSYQSVLVIAAGGIVALIFISLIAGIIAVAGAGQDTGTGIALIALLAVFLYAYARLSLLVALVADRATGPLDSLRAAWRMTAGHAGKLFLFIVAITALTIIVQSAAQLALGVTGQLLGGKEIGRLAGLIGASIISGVAQVYMCVMQARLYLQLAGGER